MDTNIYSSVEIHQNHYSKNLIDKFKKRIILIKFLLLFFAILLGNSGSAQLQTLKKPNSKTVNNKLYFDRLAKAQHDTLSKSPVIMEPQDIRKNRGTLKSSCQYTSNSEFASLTISELISYLKATGDYECHARILFSYEEAYSPTIFTNEKIQAVIAEVASIAPTYDGANSSGIYGLICYLRAATYHAYWESNISLDSKSWEDYAEATSVLCNNTHMFDLNSEAADILEEFIILIDKPGIRHNPESITFIKKVMKNMVVYDTWKDSQEIEWVDIYWNIFYLMDRGFYDDDYINAIAADEEFMSLLGSVATDIEIMNHPDLNYLWQDNAIYILSELATIPILTDRVCPYLANVCELFPRLNINWMSAIIAINGTGKCAEYGLCEDENELMTEVENTLFPETYSYDDGKLVFRTKLSREEADNLYYATNQTKAQFFRVAQTEQPIEGDANTTLKAYIFESYETYENYATYLFDIDTDNGGTYIEQRAEFYTWDRPETYSLSLEELFRHEYIHYLQGRHLIPCYFGDEFYDNDRLTWFSEGNAEFLTGSTDVEGMKLRSARMQRVVNDYPDNWASLEDVLTSSYDTPGYIHYDYGDLLWYNWYLNEYGMMKRFTDLTRSNDIEGFDELVDSLKSSPAAEVQWRNFLTSVYNGEITTWSTPTTFWLDDQILTIGNTSDIASEFSSITGINDISVSSDADTLIRRFKISGVLSSSEQASNNADAAIKISDELDEIMVQLKNDQYINNFDFTVGHFTDVTYPQNIPTANFFITGSLRSGCGSDITAPTVTDGMAVVNKTSTSFQLNWNASSDSIGVRNYALYLNNTLIDETTSSEYNFTGLIADSTYSVTIKAKDFCGNISEPSSAILVKTLDDITAIEDYISDNNSVSIFPNPSNGRFTMLIENDFIGDVTIETYNSIGNKLNILEVNKTTRKITQGFDYEHLAKGVLFMVIKYGINNEVVKSLNIN